MGKFDGILLCTDMDGTLLNSEAKISDENKEAILHFIKEGGRFTFVTGRTQGGVKEFYNELHPNMPAVLLNGSSVYDLNSEELLWGVYLADGAKNVIKLLENNFNEYMYAAYTDDSTYFGEKNKWSDLYLHITKYENIIIKPYYEVDEPWKKIILIASEEGILNIKRFLEKSEFTQKYDFMQSGKHFYEILPKGANKALGIQKIKELSKYKITKTIVVGDGENDIKAIKAADVGIAVENAMDTVKNAADFVTVSNNEHALKAIIDNLEKGVF